MSTIDSRELGEFIKKNGLLCERIFGEPDSAFSKRHARFLDNTRQIMTYLQEAEEKLRFIEVSKKEISEILELYPEISSPTEFKEMSRPGNYYDVDCWRDYAANCSCLQITMGFISHNIKVKAQTLIFTSALHNLPWACRVVLFKNDYVPAEEEKASLQTRIHEMGSIDFSGDPMFATDYGWIALRIGQISNNAILETITKLTVPSRVEYV